MPTFWESINNRLDSCTSKKKHNDKNEEDAEETPLAVAIEKGEHTTMASHHEDNGLKNNNANENDKSERTTDGPHADTSQALTDVELHVNEDRRKSKSDAEIAVEAFLVRNDHKFLEKFKKLFEDEPEPFVRDLQAIMEKLPTLNENECLALCTFFISVVEDNAELITLRNVEPIISKLSTGTSTEKEKSKYLLCIKTITEFKSQLLPERDYEQILKSIGAQENLINNESTFTVLEHLAKLSQESAEICISFIVEHFERFNVIKSNQNYREKSMHLLRKAVTTYTDQVAVEHSTVNLKIKDLMKQMVDHVMRLWIKQGHKIEDFKLLQSVLDVAKRFPQDCAEKCTSSIIEHYEEVSESYQEELNTLLKKSSVIKSEAGPTVSPIILKLARQKLNDAIQLWKQKKKTDQDTEKLQLTLGLAKAFPQILRKEEIGKFIQYLKKDSKNGRVIGYAVLDIVSKEKPELLIDHLDLILQEDSKEDQKCIERRIESATLTACSNPDAASKVLHKYFERVGKPGCTTADQFFEGMQRIAENQVQTASQLQNTFAELQQDQKYQSYNDTLKNILNTINQGKEKPNPDGIDPTDQRTDFKDTGPTETAEQKQAVPSKSKDGASEPSPSNSASYGNGESLPNTTYRAENQQAEKQS